MTFDREELLSALADASPALAKTATIPGLDHFWFDGSFVYAYDGGLGVRVAFKSELDCGLPGKALLDLLKTSALKQVDIDLDKKDVVLKLGKSKVNLASLDNDRMAWAFPTPGKKTFDKALGSLPLTEDILAAITRVAFVRHSGKATQVVHNGVTVVPQKSTTEFYATDSASLARIVVKEKPDADLPRFVAPWAFVDRFLELVEPGAVLYVLDDCLMVEGKGVLVCCNALELPDAPDLPKTLAPFITEDDSAELPAGLQSVLDRAVILAGQDEAIVDFAVDAKELVLEGKYGLGSLDEVLPLKSKMSASSGRFPANLVRRGLGQVKTFSLGDKALVLEDGEDFVYVLAAKHVPTAAKRGAKAGRTSDKESVDRRRSKREEPEEEPTTTRRRRQAREDDRDEIPF